ncbi:MAG: MvaI/BcnI family restriction endonuclease, partial [Verrucomicrobiota bacterium]|nr:MvaI/BcnI family restriction endonuclease [Verrucomicrobiota bacterium]
MSEPIEELISKMRDLYSRGYVPAEGTGSGRYGLALERELGIASNSSKKPDFKGIELKTKAGATLQTLFSRTPSHYTGCSDKLDLTLSHGYEKKGRQQLYTSMNSEGDSLGFSVVAMEDCV